MSSNKSDNPIIKYYKTHEALLGYSLILKGVKHYGYYPLGKENITIADAQELLNLRIGHKLGLAKGSKVLDAGCGEGPVSVSLAKNFGYRVYGIDLLDFNIEKARERAKKNKVEDLTDFQVGDYSKLDFPDNHFDGVFMVETLVHAPDYEKVLKELKRVLKPGGKLVLDEYTKAPRDSLTTKENRVFDELIDLVSMPAFELFIHDTFPEKLTKCGYKDIKVENFSDRIVPMTKTLRNISLLTYPILTLLGLKKHFVNAEWGYYHYGFNKRGIWRFNIITAIKPK